MENNINSKKISIIVPVYNVEKYLRKCVTSIINQTYKNLEIILIDDGSTDNSGIICDKLEKEDERIKVIHKQNEGVSVTKNLGISICTGDYIAFIDSDDFVMDDYCETLYNNLVQTNSDISIVSYNVVKEDGTIIEKATGDNGLKKDEVIVYEESDIIKELLKQNTIKNFVCKMYKKSVICYFPVGVNYEDIVFTFEVMRNAKRVVFMNKRGYNYLKRTGSITATITEKNLQDFANAIYDRYLIIKEEYPHLLNYNIYSFMESVVALSTKNLIEGRTSNYINDSVEKYLDLIREYAKYSEVDLLPLLNDFQKLCLYLIKYDNIDLYYAFLLERQRLKDLGKL